MNVWKKEAAWILITTHLNTEPQALNQHSPTKCSTLVWGKQVKYMDLKVRWSRVELLSLDILVEGKSKSTWHLQRTAYSSSCHVVHYISARLDQKKCQTSRAVTAKYCQQLLWNWSWTGWNKEFSLCHTLPSLSDVWWLLLFKDRTNKSTITVLICISFILIWILWYTQWISISRETNVYCNC